MAFMSGSYFMIGICSVYKPLFCSIFGFASISACGIGRINRSSLGCMISWLLPNSNCQPPLRMIGRLLRTRSKKAWPSPTNSFLRSINIRSRVSSESLTCFSGLARETILFRYSSALVRSPVLKAVSAAVR